MKRDTKMGTVCPEITLKGIGYKPWETWGLSLLKLKVGRIVEGSERRYSVESYFDPFNLDFPFSFN